MVVEIGTISKSLSSVIFKVSCTGNTVLLWSILVVEDHQPLHIVMCLRNVDWTCNFHRHHFFTVI